MSLSYQRSLFLHHVKKMYDKIIAIFRIQSHKLTPKHMGIRLM